MLYCEGSSKFTIKYKKLDNSDAVFTTKNVPVTIECSQLPRTGKFIYTVEFTGYFAGTCNAGNGEYGGQFIADSYSQSTDTPFPFYESCPAFKYEFFIGENKVNQIKVTSDRNISQQANPNYSKGGTYLIIKNAQGTAFFREEVKDCNYLISCGDDCPPNHIKCKCNSYPGYCCIPCNEIKGGIAAATAAVRGINRG